MKVAIIGGIGSGKSAVLSRFKELGYTTLSADEINAQMLKDPEYQAKLEELFPGVVVNGVVNKKELSQRVFNNPYELAKLNHLAHPEICKRMREETADPVIIEVPLIFESNTQDMFDEIILVTAKKKIRLERLEGRGVEKKRAKLIMWNQVSDRKLRKIATKEIDNSFGLDELSQAVDKVIGEIFNK